MGDNIHTVSHIPLNHHIDTPIRNNCNIQYKLKVDTLLQTCIMPINKNV